MALSDGLHVHRDTGVTPVDRARALAQFQRAEAGEPAALDELVHALSPAIRASVARALRRRTNSGRAAAQEVEDLVQSVLLAVFVNDGGRALLRWDPARGLDLEGFAALLATHEVDSILRCRRRNPWTEEPVRAEALDEAPNSLVGPETQAGSRRLLFAVAARLRAEVSARGFALFELLFLQERAPEDVAASEGLGLPAVYAWRSRLARAAREIAVDLEGDRDRRVVRRRRSPVRPRPPRAPRATVP